MPEWDVSGYTPVRVLGSGGFGEVVLARHDASGTLVAIKYLRADLLTAPGFADMFRGEATVLASLQDPNIVQLYEYVESQAGAAIVMELVAGLSLREILIQQGQTTPEAALVVLQGSLLGLAAAHQRGVVHRDYKPENVLVAGDGTSKLTDFGLAARTGDRPFPSGTVSYMSPEQVAGGPASPASDVYAATATFYECLTGQPPFTGESAEVLRQHRYEPVPLEPVPSPLRPLVAAGMAKDPARRPADARAFVTELETVASGTYGPDWHRRGQSHLGEAALLLAALWPAGELAALQATTALQRIPLLRNLTRVKALRHLTPVKAAVAAAPIKAAVIAGAAVVAAGTAVTVAATVAHTTAPPSQLTPGVSGSPTPGQFPTQSGSPAPGGGNGPPTGTQTIPPTGGLLTTVPPTTGSPPSSAPSSNPPPSTPPPSTPPPSSPPPSTPPPSSPPPSTAPASAPPTFGLTLTIHHDGRGTAGRPRTIRLPAATAASTAITPQ